MENKELNCLDIYHNEIPSLIENCLDTEEMQRLKDVGMNCGCEYTSFSRFLNLKRYSRYTHSLGVALITYHFTLDEKQAAAGLFHDISTPVFAHVIDFMKGDYLKQEATEMNTEEMIASSQKICSILSDNGLTIADVSNYHLYPIADNDSPKLSADRLEYTLGNGINYGFATKEEIKKIYDNLVVGRNEDGIDELCFKDERLAEKFALMSLNCSKVYVCDEDRYSMQILSEIVADAIKRNVIKENELYETETYVIDKLLSDEISRSGWMKYRNLSRMYTAENEMTDGQYRIVHAKKRYIDPMVIDKGRVSVFSESFKSELDRFLKSNQNKWIRGE